MTSHSPVHHERDEAAVGAETGADGARARRGARQRGGLLVSVLEVVLSVSVSVSVSGRGSGRGGVEVGVFGVPCYR